VRANESENPDKRLSEDEMLAQLVYVFSPFLLTFYLTPSSLSYLRLPSSSQP
jgi:hypothetical protein